MGKDKPDLRNETGANEKFYYTTSGLTTMSLSVRGIGADVGKKSVNRFTSRIPAISPLPA